MVSPSPRLVLFSCLMFAAAACSNPSQDASVCLGVDCSGHGACTDEGGQAACQCESGYQALALACLPAQGICAGVDCSGHGECLEQNGQPSCACQSGYLAQGLACLPDGHLLAAGVRISELALFQAVKVSLYRDGQFQTDRSAAVIAGRAALLRVYVEPEGAAAGSDLLAELELGDGTVLRSSMTLGGPSTDDDPDSTLLFTLPAEAVRQDTSLTVRLVDPNQAPTAEGLPHPARLPQAGGLFELEAQDSGGALRLVIVPVEYNTDGSGRQPDLGQAALDEIRALLRAAYPLDRVDISVHQALSWNHPLNWWNQNFNFGLLNEELIDLKEADQAPTETYYYGLVSPAESFEDYCFYSCTTGQGFVVDDPADGSIRVGSGLGFPGERWAWTLLHELGHQHGLGHAPCDTGGEPGYPYAGGVIGSWGYDERSGDFLSPDHNDFMGYCSERWVSDYNFDRLFERVRAVNSLGRPAWPEPQALRFLHRDSEGRSRWGKRIRLHPPQGQPTLELGYLDASGKTVARGWAIWIATGDGGQTLLIPDGPASAARLEFALPADGQLNRVDLP